MAALGDYEAELLGRPTHGVVGVLVPPRPQFARGSGQFDSNLTFGGLLAPHRVRPPSRDVAQLGDVAQPRRGGPVHAQRVHDVHAVRPRLHEPRGEEGPGAHRRSVPDDPRVLAQRRGGLVETLAVGAPRAQLLAGREPAKGAQRVLVDALGGRAREELGQLGAEAFRVDDRRGRGGVEEGQVPDLVGHAPARARCRRAPLLGRDGGDDGVERALLVAEVCAQPLQVARLLERAGRHGRDPASRSEGTSTTRLRSHSPRPLAWASWRVDAATPSWRRSWMTKLRERSAGSR